MLLLDEPLAALDRKLREQTRIELVRIQRQVGTTFLFVTHDQDEAMTLSRRIAIMRSGRIVQVGSPSAIYDAPESRFVAEFIGQVNVFEGTVEDDDGTCVHVRVPSLDGSIRAQSADRSLRGRNVCVAVRPERILLGAEPHAVNRMAGTVDQVAYRGDVTDLHVTTGTGVGLIRIAVSNAISGAPRPNPGDRIAFSWPTAAGVVLTR